MKSPAKKKARPSALSGRTGYAVRFRLQVHGCFAALSSLDVFLERYETMPIPPQVGMEVSNGDWAATIKEIYVDIEKGLIEAYCGEDKEIYEADLHREKHRPIEEIVAEYVESGWTVIKA